MGPAAQVVGRSSRTADRVARLGHNIVANFAGRTSTIVLGVAFVPVYLSILGPEGYGLIALFATLQSVLSLFDFGLGTTLTRRLALDSAEPGREASMRDFTRTVEAVYWLTALVIAVVWVALTGIIARDWIRPKGLSLDEARSAIRLMGVAAALQFPFALYGGGLLGLQRQVRYNVALTGIGVVRSVGAVLVLVLVSPTVEAFFWWQVVVSAGQSILGARLLWGSLPHRADRARFDWSHVGAVWRFAAGTGGTAALGAVRTHLDKVILSRMLPLEQFGYYSLAGVLGAGVYFLATPFYMAYFPRLSEVVAERDGEKLSSAYHEGCQLVSAIVIPAAAVAAVFAEEIIFVWIGNAGIASSASAVASLLVVGYALAALNGLPYTLQLASGWTGLAFRISLTTLIAAGPLIVVGTMAYGAPGAAGAWLAINGVYTVAMVQGMHRRLLPGETARWYLVDVGLPALACSTLAMVGRYVMPPALHRGPLLVYIGGLSILALSAAIAVAPFPRRALSIACRRAVAAAGHAR